LKIGYGFLTDEEKSDLFKEQLKKCCLHTQPGAIKICWCK